MGLGLASGMHLQSFLDNPLPLSCCTQSNAERQQELKSVDKLFFSPQHHLQALQQLTGKRYLIPFIYFQLIQFILFIQNELFNYSFYWY